jgi:hypothetical protein
MCSRHWFRVPAKLRAAVWRAYHDETGGKEHRQLIREAIRSVAEAR